jgi:hypothetical protein
MPGPGATTGDDTFVGDDLLLGESSQTSTGALFAPGDDTLNDGAGGDPSHRWRGNDILNWGAWLMNGATPTGLGLGGVAHGWVIDPGN